MKETFYKMMAVLTLSHGSETWIKKNKTASKILTVEIKLFKK
jgi:hypothetical protein